MMDLLSRNRVFELKLVEISYTGLPGGSRMMYIPMETELSTAVSAFSMTLFFSSLSIDLRSKIRCDTALD
jgi:hypothetical protein